MIAMETLYARKLYTDRIQGFVGKDVIKIIAGVRRCGKSEILKLIRNEIAKSVGEDRIIFINFESLEFDFIKTYLDLHRYVEEKILDGQKYYLFFDEIQSVLEWERAVNSLRLKNTDIYITGSNSKLLSGELATLLGGRTVSFEIAPLTFGEFLDFHSAAVKKLSVSEMLMRYISFGGFPFVALNDFSEEQADLVVRGIHSDTVLKDVISRNSIKNANLLEKIIAYFYDNIGQVTSLRKIAEYISGGDKRKAAVNLETVKNYVGYLETAYIIRKAPRYDIKGKKVFETNDKYYLADHSLAYVIKDRARVNRGGILENIVFNELSVRSYKVYVGVLGAKEIDFIAEKKGERIYVQVCLEFTSDEVKSREFSPLKEIGDNYPKYVVSTDGNANGSADGIIGLHLKDFLTQKVL